MGGCPPLPLSEKRVNLQLQLIKFLGVIVFQPTNSFGSPLACLNRFFRPHVMVPPGGEELHSTALVCIVCYFFFLLSPSPSLTHTCRHMHTHMHITCVWINLVKQNTLRYFILCMDMFVCFVLSFSVKQWNKCWLKLSSL